MSRVDKLVKERTEKKEKQTTKGNKKDSQGEIRKDHFLFVAKS